MDARAVPGAVCEVLRQSGKTLRAFATMIHISPAYLSDVSRGNRKLSPAMAERLASHKPKRSVRDWMLLQMDDDIAALKAKRQRLAASR